MINEEMLRKINALPNDTRGLIEDLVADLLLQNDKSLSVTDINIPDKNKTSKFIEMQTNGMHKEFKLSDYQKGLNPKQQESYNFQKVSAVLADFGYTTIKLSDDWNGADFIALHHDGKSFNVQLKGRLTFAKKYKNKNLWLCFPDGADWYLYPHDILLEQVLPAIKDSKSWGGDEEKEKGGYSFPSLSPNLKELLSPYNLTKLKKNLRLYECEKTDGDIRPSSSKELIMFDRISINPAICHGQACIKGTRIPAYQIIGMLANGDTFESLLQVYSTITTEDIRACLEYGAWLAEEHSAVEESGIEA
jgi:uncharacterized protein (DUF433 family)